MTTKTEFQVFKTFNPETYGIYGFWQVSYSGDHYIQQLIDCHDFLIEAQQMDWCQYTNTPAHQFTEKLIAHIDTHEIDLEDIELEQMLFDDIEPEFISEAVWDTINYEISGYMGQLNSNENFFFGHNPGGGCLGFWPNDENQP